MSKKRVKILAIDDNNDNLVVLHALVAESFPYAEFVSAGSGSEGLNKCKLVKPDVILLDLVMPDIDGFEVCRRLKSDEAYRSIPIIILTANNDSPNARIKALESGADAFLTKPVDDSELKAQISAMLRIKEADDLKDKYREELEQMVKERTVALETELADRKRAEKKLIQSLDKLNRNRLAILNLMEDLKQEMDERKRAEKGLEDERNLLRTLIDNLPDTIYILDREGRKVIANRADVRNIGFDDEASVVGKCDLELFPEEIGKRGHNDNLSVINTGVPIIDREEYFNTSDGNIMWLNTSKYPLYDSDGKLIGLFGTGHDITTRKIFEQQLKRKNEDLSFLNTLATELTMLKPADNIHEFLARKIKDFSGAYVAVTLDYIPEKRSIQIKHVETDKEVINKVANSLGKKFYDTLIPVTDENMNFLIKEYFAVSGSLTELTFGQIPEIADKLIRKVTGVKTFYAIANVIGAEYIGTTMLGFREGAVEPAKEVLVAYARMAATTIKRRRSEEKLKESEEKYRLLIENQGEGVGIVDLDEQFVFVNPAAEVMFGVEKGGLIHKSLLDFIGPENKALIQQENKKRSKGERSNYELNILRPNGEKRTILITATPQFSKEGKLTGTFGVFRDITERKAAENEVVKKQEFIEKILENAPIGFAVNRISDGTVVYIGSKFEEIYGVPKGSLNSVNDFFDTVYTDPDFREAMRERTMNDISSNDPKRMRWEDIEITTRNGEQRFFTAINIPLFEQDLMISTVQDVTARNNSEKALKEIHQFNDTLLSTIPFGMDIVDEQGTVLFQSARFHELFGDDAIGCKCWELYRADKRQCENCPLLNGIEIGKTMNYESEGVLNNRVFSISHTGILFQGKKAMLEIFIDITERKQMENKIIESEAYYRTLIDTSPDGIITSDLEGNVTYFSIKSYEIFSEYPETNITGKSILTWVDAEFQQDVSERITDILNGNLAPVTKEYRLLKSDRSSFWAEISSSPLTDKDGLPTGLLIVCRDISQRKRYEAELIRERDRAEENDKLKTAFLHNISHEIRTPMNAIIGFSSLLVEPGQTDESRAYFGEVISGSCNQLLEVVSDIIEISNIEAGILSYKKEIININDQLNILKLQYLPKAREKNIEFIFHSRPGTETAVAETDSAKFQKIMTSLLNNAFKFTASGRIEFGFSHVNDMWQFYVSDTGIGIPADEQQKIFDRFYQVEHSVSRTYEGLGLGLAISKAYSEFLGGKIWVESVPGNGSVFYFTLPFSKQSETVKVKKDGEKVIKPPVNREKKILIAEDDDNNYRFLEKILSLSAPDIGLIRARNGEEAVELCSIMPQPGLVLMDIKMPVMNGYDATRKIKEQWPDIKVVAQTAYAFESDREKVTEAGCDDYITKPIRKEALLEIIAKYI